MLFNSSLANNAGSRLPEITARIRLAFARGDASSDGASRKIGHIRASGDWVRQRPQPLQAAEVDPNEPFQINWSSRPFAVAVTGGWLPPFCVVVSCGSATTVPFAVVRRFLVIGCGTSA